MLAEFIQVFVVLWAVIDPIGTIPVFLAVTRRHRPEELRLIATQAVAIAGAILLFFIVAGQFLLDSLNVPLAAFQVSGGLVLLAFAFTMIFGEAKPEEELRMLDDGLETAVFPLAVPSIAGPGAMMAVVLLTDSHRFDFIHQLMTTGILLLVLLITWLLLLAAGPIGRLIGAAGASVVSRVMGMILSAIAVDSVLAGIRAYYGI